MMPQSFVCLLIEACPDLQFSVDGVLFNDDEVVVCWSMCGTHTCPLLDRAPTGKLVNLKGVSAYRMVNGAPLESRDEVDINSLMAELGIALG